MNSRRPTTRPANRRLRHFFAPIALAVLAVGAAACGDDDSTDSGGGEGAGGTVTVTDVWAREPAAGADRLAAYGVVTNETGAEITLVGVESPVGSVTELHETNVDDAGTMSMQERENGFAVGAGDTFTLEPGGAHVMIFEVSADELAEPFDLTFMFDGADDVTAPVALVALGADDEMDMDDGETHGTDMDGDTDDDMHDGTDSDG